MDRDNSPLSFEKLVEEMKKHLIIEDSDIEAAKLLLHYTDYATLMEYAQIHTNQISRQRKVHFQKVKNMCAFDTKLRALLLKYLHPLELFFRTILSHCFALSHCDSKHETAYLDHASYDMDQKFSVNRKDALRKVIYATENASKFYGDRNWYKRCIEKYGMNPSNTKLPRFPVWMWVRLMSFATLSKWYSLMTESDKSIIAKALNTHPSWLENHLHCLSVLRNRCSHANRLCGASMQPIARIPKILPNSINRTLFGYVIILLQRLPSEQEMDNFTDEFIDLIEEFSTPQSLIDFSSIGVDIDQYKKQLQDCRRPAPHLPWDGDNDIVRKRIKYEED